jgi:hypothetical protein
MRQTAPIDGNSMRRNSWGFGRELRQARYFICLYEEGTVDPCDPAAGMLAKQIRLGDRNRLNPVRARVFNTNDETCARSEYLGMTLDFHVQARKFTYLD